jgi:hypothetical protein
MMEEMESFGFDGSKPRPCSVTREEYGNALVAFIKADNALAEAKGKVPSYTGQ